MIRFAVATLNQVALDFKGNQERIIRALTDAKDIKSNFLCLPELAISGYGCEDMFLAPFIIERSIESLTQIIPHTKGLFTGIGLPIMIDSKIYNGAAVCSDGELKGIYLKRHLAGDGVHYEPRWFTPWPEQKVTEIEIAERKIRAGDLIFKIEDLNLGFEICQDAWISGRNLGLDIILNPSASHFSFDKDELRRALVIDRSRENSGVYLYSNLLGNEAGRLIYDGNRYISCGGKLLLSRCIPSFKDVVLDAADIDSGQFKAEKLRQKSSDSLKGISNEQIITLKSPEEDLNTSKPLIPLPIIEKPLTRFEQFEKICALGLFDYLRKSKSKGFVISLSGGADSAAVFILSYLALKNSFEELGPELFSNALSRETSDLKFNKICKESIITIYQATKNNSSKTFEIAKDLSDLLGSHFLDWNLDSAVKDFTKKVELSLNTKLTWSEHDLSLQNIQARLRSPGAWLVANLKGMLLLSTSNRSEAAVGYATMDGDTSGGLSPIAGIDKAFLIEWLKSLNQRKVLNLENSELLLKRLTSQKPTAELKPGIQEDEKELMPYPILNQIELMAIRDKLSPEQILKNLQITEHKYSQNELKSWIERFFTLWCRNQWKRERYAPSFHVDDENLDPKSWCRYPILTKFSIWND